MSNTVSFTFNLQTVIHKTILVRASVYTQCSTENTTVVMTLFGDTANVPVTSNLITTTETLIEGQVLHTGSTFTLSFSFGTQADTCSKLIQDISIYYEKCHSYCGSNDCPNIEPYYRHPVNLQCISDCPEGFNEAVGNTCAARAFCHSTCDTCSLPNDPTKCLTCSSSFTALLPFNAMTAGTPAACSLPATNNAQLLLTVNKNTVIGTSQLKSVTYNTATTQATSGTLLSGFLYKENVI